MIEVFVEDSPLFLRNMTFLSCLRVCLLPTFPLWKGGGGVVLCCSVPMTSSGGCSGQWESNSRSWSVSEELRLHLYGG